MCAVNAKLLQDLARYQLSTKPECHQPGSVTELSSTSAHVKAVQVSSALDARRHTGVLGWQMCSGLTDEVRDL
jgi:hypothetical protein